MRQRCHNSRVIGHSPLPGLDDAPTHRGYAGAALRARKPGNAIYAIRRELHLADRFGVSRTPVREALSRLQQEQLLVRIDRGLRISEADPERVIKVYELRIQLESTAAAEAARSHQLSDLLQLQTLISRDRGWAERLTKRKKPSAWSFTPPSGGDA